VLVVNGNSPIKTLEQLIELAKSKTTNITNSTLGAPTSLLGQSWRFLDFCANGMKEWHRR
jgi:hypothetical protein